MAGEGGREPGDRVNTFAKISWFDSWRLWYDSNMHTTLPTLDRILEPVAACFSPEVAALIVNVRWDDEATMQRLEELREKANEGTLTESERDEYEAFVEANDIFMLLKDKARSLLPHE